MSVLGLYYDIETFPYCEGNKNDREIESMDGFKFSISGCRHEILKLNINNQNINPLSKTEPNLIKKNGDCDLSDEFKDKIYFSDIVAFGSSYIRDLGVNFNPNFMDKKSIGVKYLNVLIKELLENEL
jgi:hypothetical protein